MARYETIAHTAEMPHGSRRRDQVQPRKERPLRDIPVAFACLHRAVLAQASAGDIENIGHRANLIHH